MGELGVNDGAGDAHYRTFTKKLLEDVRALEQMLERGMFESGVRRIGAEQEMFIVDSAGRPAPIADRLLDALKVDPRFTPELALFNLEANLPPRLFEGDCLRAMEHDLLDVVSIARKAAEGMGAGIVLTGILPTLRLSDLGIEAMTPAPRYLALNRMMSAMRGGSFQTNIEGLDELQAAHDNILLEACNTSFQIHFQVGPEEFAPMYNLAQVVTAPVLAAAVNSPVLLQHRLWSETRIALFQQSVDARSQKMAERGRRARVSFGERWVDRSIIEIFREDIARMRVVIAQSIDKDSLADVAAGRAPHLTALMLHNGTVYRWNRPCYGVADGIAHLRIENRALPSGPTPLDEVANAAFYFGLMSGMAEDAATLPSRLAFDDAKSNFVQAARHGLKAQLTWFGGAERRVSDLILDELTPIARAGLASKGIAPDDIERYIGTIEARVQTMQTGAQWSLKSLAAMDGGGTRFERSGALVQSAQRQEKANTPVHEWALASLDRQADWWESYQTVEQVMATDPVTLRGSDIVDLAATVMDWERIRHIPVEDNDGRLEGLVTHRCLFALLGASPDESKAVSELMRTDVITVGPETPTVDALRRMRDHGVGCLPVIDADRKLVGMITQAALLDVALLLFEDRLGVGPAKKP